MSNITEIRPKNFEEFVRLIEKRQSLTDDPLWFRGCGKANYSLTPTLYRHPTKKRVTDVAALERQLITHFRQRSIPFHNRSLSDEWEALFFVQHYGVPTRLLDWTENPFMGLYFAFMECPSKISSKGIISFRSPAAVWVLNPTLWNRHALKNQSFDGKVLTSADDSLKGYRPLASFDGMNNLPVALYGTHNSTRIVAQRGVFTIFGQGRIPMERMFRENNFPKDSLLKITILPNNLPKFRKSLFRNGITESVVFPDLEGLAKEIKKIFAFT